MLRSLERRDILVVNLPKLALARGVPTTVTPRTSRTMRNEMIVQRKLDLVSNPRVEMSLHRLLVGLLRILAPKLCDAENVRVDGKLVPLETDA